MSQNRQERVTLLIKRVKSEGIAFLKTNTVETELTRPHALIDISLKSDEFCTFPITLENSLKSDEFCTFRSFRMAQ